MSVAFVSGVAAMLRAHGYDNAGAVDRIERTADDILAKGRDDESGYGILDAARALGAKSSPAPKATQKVQRPRPVTSRVTAAGSARAVPSRKASPSSRTPKVPTVVAVGPLDIRGTKRGAEVTAAAALIGALIIGHSLRALAARRS
jgi:hypothetical protein